MSASGPSGPLVQILANKEHQMSKQSTFVTNDRQGCTYVYAKCACAYNLTLQVATVNMS